MKCLAAAIAVVGLVSVQYGVAFSAKTPAPAVSPSQVSPVLVELFTSEGCSDCPPADTLVQQLDERQPISGAQLIVLSEHIDYFNHDGWKDPYSSSLLTERQYAYAHALGLKDVFTPQILVDGVYELWGKTSQQMEDVLRQASATPTIPVRIRDAKIDSGSPLLRAHIEVDGTRERHNADIYAAVALDHAESQVLRGENGGRHLTHVAVVRILKPVGKLKKGKTLDADIAIKLNPGDVSANLRLIVFVQESGPGRVVGATLQKQLNRQPAP
ncbi:MAG: DUF1223 domain-containing protein [Acidobacteriaceae bacterium]